MTPEQLAQLIDALNQAKAAGVDLNSVLVALVAVISLAGFLEVRAKSWFYKALPCKGSCPHGRRRVDDAEVKPPCEQ